MSQEASGNGIGPGATATQNANRNWVLGDGLEPGDAYQEGPYVVFTAQYHLRRGYCCNSGCRHCPYREADTDGE